MRPLTSPGTPALVAVPAHPGLFGDHDRALGQHRRYTAQQLLDEVAPWIEVVDHGPLFPSLVAPRAASVALERLRMRIGGEHAAHEARGGRPVVPLADAGATRRFARVGRHLTGLSHWAFGTTR